MLKLNANQGNFIANHSKKSSFGSNLTKPIECYEKQIIKQCQNSAQFVKGLLSEPEKLDEFLSEVTLPDGDKIIPAKFIKVSVGNNSLWDELVSVIKEKILSKNGVGMPIKDVPPNVEITKKQILEYVKDENYSKRISDGLSERIIGGTLENLKQEELLTSNASPVQYYFVEKVLDDIKRKIFDNPKVVALVDDWKTTVGNLKKHGSYTERVIKGCSPDTKIIKIQMPVAKFSDGTKGYHERAVYIALRKLEKAMEKGEIPEGINLSLGWSMNFDTFSTHLDEIKNALEHSFETKNMSIPEYFSELPEKITPENIAENKQNIKKLIKDFYSNYKNELLENHKTNLKNGVTDTPMEDIALYTPFYIWLHENITQIEKFSKEKNILFTLAAGNDGKNNFNILSLADNIVTVGAINKKGNIAEWSADNSLIDKFSAGKFVYKPVDNLTPDIKDKKGLKDMINTIMQGKAFEVVIGTSLSAPYELMMRLKEKINI